MTAGHFQLIDTRREAYRLVLYAKRPGQDVCTISFVKER